MTDNPTLILPRRNFLVRALGFTAAGAALPVSIITADDAKARMEHHQKELQRAWQDYYGPTYNVRICEHFTPRGETYVYKGMTRNEGSSFLICCGNERIA